ncbi:Tyrosine-protein kinase [Citrifermentans bremense]|uniref:Tyrosine-protein kinase n=1 Tax=Citrifermentans bremense TaxID=60035 RepID=A0A6S6M290_9BACT|nr:Wzz/FepE/Etk N-terminal domain-containing protein [Citrifermentans bremense]BCG47778.1 Tyrosine-protein kinase [Citrifermentans bremense]
MELSNEKIENYNGNQPGSYSLHDLVQFIFIILKFKRFIFLFSFFVAFLAIIATLIMPDVYTAKALILPADDDKGMMGSMLAQLGGFAGVAGVNGPSKADQYITMLSSETVKDNIVEKYKLKQVYGVKLKTDAYKLLDKNTSIFVGKKDGIITIAFDDEDPKRASSVTNSYVEELDKITAGLGMSSAAKTRFFLEGQLALAKVKLAKAEELMKNFQAKNKTFSVPDQAKASIEGIAILRAQLASQEIQLGALQRQFTDSSQEVKGAKASISNIKAQIAMLEGKGGTSALPSVGSVPLLGEEYARLFRDLKIQETLVELITKQYEMAKLSEAKDVSSFQVIQRASVPEIKSSPERAKIVLVSSLIAFFTSIFMVMLINSWQRLDYTLKCELINAFKPNSRP